MRQAASADGYGFRARAFGASRNDEGIGVGLLTRPRYRYATRGSNSPLPYRLAISAVVSTFLILLAWPAVLNSCSRCLQSLVMASMAGLRYLRGSNSSGWSFRTLRIWPVIAMRLSVSMLILRTPFLMPRWISETGTPQVGFILPPLALMISCRSFGTEDEPCITRWVFGSLRWISSITFMARMSPSGLRVNL